MLNVQNILTRLCARPGPSGRETTVSAAAAECLAPLVGRVETDRLGNVLGYLPCGEENAPVLLLDAHLDEVGVMVTAREEGYLRFRPVGGLDPRVMPAQRVRFLTDPPVLGVVACLPPHIQTGEEQHTVQPLEELYIDTGGAEIPAGTMGVFDLSAPFQAGFALGARQFSAKSLDDRACFAVLLRALELLPAIELLRGRTRRADIVVCGSVMEETGRIGAETAAYGVQPDYAVVMDVGFGQSPDAPGDGTFKPGGGPILTLAPECSRRLSATLQSAAKEAGIPLQIEVCPRGSGTNASAYQISRRGVACAVLGVPLKYMHTPVETVHLNDIENAARLLAEWIAAGEFHARETE
ncbi:MAG: M20/M25/M40 family metallo-hydrolase [Oscillospiraceae bacterium]|nr:M20/M25/M40 family metallo-hydrolase [Oscillospiraceae bacterium]